MWRASDNVLEEVLLRKIINSAIPTDVRIVKVIQRQTLPYRSDENHYLVIRESPVLR